MGKKKDKENIKKVLKKINKLNYKSLIKLRNEINSLISAHEFIKISKDTEKFLLSKMSDFICDELDFIDLIYWDKTIISTEEYYCKTFTSLNVSEFLNAMICGDKKKFGIKKLFLINDCIKDKNVFFIDQEEFIKNYNLTTLSDEEFESKIHFLNYDLDIILPRKNYNNLLNGISNYYGRNDIKVFDLLALDRDDLLSFNRVSVKTVEKMENELKLAGLDFNTALTSKQIDDLFLYDKEINKELKKYGY